MPVTPPPTPPRAQQPLVGCNDDGGERSGDDDGGERSDDDDGMTCDA